VITLSTLLHALPHLPPTWPHLNLCLAEEVDVLRLTDYLKQDIFPVVESVYIYCKQPVKGDGMAEMLKGWTSFFLVSKTL